MKKIIIFILFFVAIERFTYLQTGGFTPYKLISSEQRLVYPDNQEDLNAKEILNQPFYYLGKGVQFFAFISKDNQYVLKFIKHQRSSPRFWFDSHKGLLRLQKIVDSCQIAYYALKEETGLISLHLRPDPVQPHLFCLIDNLGIAHTINLNETSYVLQKRAEEITNRALTREDIHALVSLMKRRYHQGIYNEDPRLRNFGFNGESPMEIDLGSFIKHEKEEPLIEALQRETQELKLWLNKYDATLAHYLSEKIQEA